jgi:hypothetical protein
MSDKIDVQRYKELFNKLDTNGDGKINIKDIIILYEKIKMEQYKINNPNDDFKVILFQHLNINSRNKILN